MSKSNKYKYRLTPKVDEVSTTSSVGSYLSPFAFAKKPKAPKYYKKLGYKPVDKKKLRKKVKGIDYVDLWEKENSFKYKLKEQDEVEKFEATKPELFQQERIKAFDQLTKRIKDIRALIAKGKLETIRFYRENPNSFEVVRGTDIIEDYFKDIETLLQQE